ncbi:MAG: OmpA family protein [Chryseolinea sp.]
MTNCEFVWRRKFLCLTIFVGALFYTISISAQNLAPNPSFEEYDVCPGDFSQAAHEFRVRSWRSANLGTPDHFNDCSIGEADVPHNWAGVSYPYEGKGYVGIYLWMDKENNYREYLQCKLLSSLLKDSLYEIEFHYKLSSYSKYSIDRIGLMLTDSLVNVKHDQVISVQPTLSIIQDSALTKETGYWETARKEYRAVGGEQYVTIGNFFDNQTTHHYFIRFSPVQQIMLEKSAYYYIDEVKVVPLFNTQHSQLTEVVSEFKQDQVVLDKAYILRNIQFEFDQSVLRSSSFSELDGIVSWLKKNPSINVALSGHTDDQGNDAYNLTLSTNRAKRVASYLIDHGILSTRIETCGYGKSKPLGDGITEGAREMNRRVEITFLR